MTKEDAKAAYTALMKFYPLTLDNLGGEEWKDIAGYEGKYQVSNFGRVKSFKQHVTRILKPKLNENGYLYFSLSKSNVAKNNLSHRLVAEAFNPKIEGKNDVNHLDGHPLNNYVKNLEWATRKENLQHAVRIGLWNLGEEHHNAKLTNEQATLIRENHDNLSRNELAKKFCVTPSTISLVQLGKIYKKVGGKIRVKNKSPFRVSDEHRNAIRQLRSQGAKVKDLADMFNVHIRTIFKILKEGDDNN